MIPEHPVDHSLAQVAPDETSLWSDSLTDASERPAGQIIYAYHRFARATSTPVTPDTAVRSVPSFASDESATRRKSDQRDLLMFPSQIRTRPLPDWRTQAESLSAQRLEQESPVTEQGPPIA